MGLETKEVVTVEKEARCSQKLKIMYLMKILMENTDEEHAITLVEIVSRLKEYGISAERKSIYSDIENLRAYGIDVEGYQLDRTYYYKVVNRKFDTAELKLLVDSVQSARFITEKKSRDLIKKLEAYTSKYEAAKLDRQVSVAGRVKTMNERIYYSVDAIHEALSNNYQITFQYFSWNLKKQMEYRHDGEYYCVSPWALCWDDDQYYLIGYDNKEEKIKHFRVDKMVNTSIVEEDRLGKEAFAKVPLAEYTDRLFGMFEGDSEKVRLRCENGLANVIIDRFGNDIPIIKVDDEHFETTVKVSVSRMFLGWIMSLPGVKIVSPQSTIDMMKDEIARLQAMYS